MRALEVPVDPAALAWAMRRAGLSPEGLAEAGGVKPQKAEAWLAGRARPTYKQAKKLARRLRVSLGQLLIPPPERIDLPIADLRRGVSEREEPSPDLLETVYDALRKRDWWREYRGGVPFPFVGSFDWQKVTAEEVANALRGYIPVEAIREEARSWDDFLRRLSARAEEVGILVLRTGVVRNNNHRPLDPEELSGFSIADPVAPIVLVNTRDYVARRNFTFAHELAHIWLGQSAVDDNPEAETRHRLERFCDQVAAEFLVPRQTFREVWRGEPREAAEMAARRFWVSTWVVARRAWDLKLITYEAYRGLVDAYYEELRKQQRDREDGRGDVYLTLAARNSPTFTRAVVSAALQGEITLKEAASLVNLSIGSFLTYLERRSGALSS